MATDVRVCFVGDSFVAGVGDAEHLGWVGRLSAYSHLSGQPLTAYNLGVRRETTADVLRRQSNECAARLPPGCAAGVVLSVGVNDTTLLGGRPRVASPYSAANLDMMLRQARDAAWPTLVVGPPAVDDEYQNDRIAGLDGLFAALCQRRGVPYVGVQAELRRDPGWRREIRAGDGAHPGTGGYQVLAELVLPAWSAWLTGLGGNRWATPLA
ncbi:MAG TPA: GDSL-type esterase/lipase family protein [Nakamurella sp.]|jgi:lysophospholipase L1-like esterase